MFRQAPIFGCLEPVATRVRISECRIRRNVSAPQPALLVNTLTVLPAYPAVRLPLVHVQPDIIRCTVHIVGVVQEEVTVCLIQTQPFVSLWVAALLILALTVQLQPQQLLLRPLHVPPRITTWEDTILMEVAHPEDTA